MELIGKLKSSDTSNIGVLTSASKYVSINVLEHCLNIITNKDRLNRLKGSTKMKKREHIFKFDPGLYKIQQNDYVDHRGMKLRRNM